MLINAQRGVSPAAVVLWGCVVYVAVAAGLYVAISSKGGVDSRPAPTAAPPRATPPEGAITGPANQQELLARAAQKRSAHDYQGAKEAYSQLVQQNAMTADAWADYADTIASLAGGSLGGEAGAAIRQALTLDPNHPKALWLEATRAYQEHRYTEAVALWKRLRAVLGADSPDVGIIDANIAESEQLAQTPAG